MPAQKGITSLVLGNIETTQVKYNLYSYLGVDFHISSSGWFSTMLVEATGILFEWVQDLISPQTT